MSSFLPSFQAPQSKRNIVRGVFFGGINSHDQFRKICVLYVYERKFNYLDPVHAGPDEYSSYWLSITFGVENCRVGSVYDSFLRPFGVFAISSHDKYLILH